MQRLREHREHSAVCLVAVFCPITSLDQPSHLRASAGDEKTYGCHVQTAPNGFSHIAASSARNRPPRPLGNRVVLVSAIQCPSDCRIFSSVYDISRIPVLLSRPFNEWLPSILCFRREHSRPIHSPRSILPECAPPIRYLESRKDAWLRPFVACIVILKHFRIRLRSGSNRAGSPIPVAVLKMMRLRRSKKR
jgi:hypothetical protein